MGDRMSWNLLHYLRNLAGLWPAEGTSDAELLAAFTNRGDGRAFTAIVGRHGQRVWNVCRHVLGDTPEAEDAFQATFLALAQKASQLRRGSLAPWLHKVAQRTALNARKLGRRREQMHRRLHDELKARNAERTPDEDRALLMKELEGLPEQLRVPLVLYYLEGKTQAQVARVLCISERGVARRVDRALQFLRQRLRRRGLLVTVPALAAMLVPNQSAAALSLQLSIETARTAANGRAAEIAAGLTSSHPGSSLAIKPTLLLALVLLIATAAGGLVFLSRDKPETRTPDEKFSFVYLSRLEIRVEDAGRPFRYTNYPSAGGGIPVNQVERRFNSFGQLVREAQEHVGVVVAGTPTVQYGYSFDPEQPTPPNHSRPASIVYPASALTRRGRSPTSTTPT
jgi:RNA polymerase sigma factor (sigma-70 family)